MHHSGFRSMCCGYVVQVIRYRLCICRYLWLREPDEVSTLIIATAILIAS